MTAYAIALAIRARHETGSDHVDGAEPAPAPPPERTR
jgi:hypothetical protein